MPIIPSQAPNEATSALQTGLAQIHGTTELGKYPAPLAKGLEAHWLESEGIPHETYNLRLDAITAGRGLEMAEPVGWRYMLSEPAVQPTTAAEVYRGANEPYTFAGLNYGPFSGQTLDLIKKAEEDPEIRQGNYEPRLLRVPALYVVALWLKDRETGKDILIPFAPSPPALTPGRHYNTAEFDAALLGMAHERDRSAIAP